MDPGSPLSAPSGDRAYPSGTEPLSDEGEKKHVQKGKLGRLWKSIGLNWATMLKMLKGALPQTIVIAMYQSSTISDITTTVGFISAIMAVASQCLYPRAKFMKIMFYNLLSACTSAALCCLAVFSAVKAREHTTPAGGDLDDYNSSASAVCGVWLMFAIWISNTLRAYKQQELQDPMVAFAIFASITLTQAAQFSSVADGLGFIRQLLLAFLLGFVIATGVSLLILPITNRRNFFMGTRKYAATIENILEAQKAYVKEHHNQLARQSQSSAFDGRHSKQESSVLRDESKMNELKSIMISFIGTHDKLHGDLAYAKNEISWGKLTASDLEGIFSHLRSLFLPLAGLSMLPDIFQSLDGDWIAHQTDVASLNGSTIERNRKSFLQPLIDELNTITNFVNTGVQHSLLKLEITHAKGSKRWSGRPLSPDADVERSHDPTVPGSIGFAFYLQTEANKFFDRQKRMHESLAASATASRGNPIGTTPDKVFEDNEGFFVFLFVQHLYGALLQATLEFITFADGKNADGTMRGSRIIFPQGPFIMAWLALGAGSDDRSMPGAENDGDPTNQPIDAVDPEHLPPRNVWERGGNVLRYISRIMASDESVFGFRAAAASLSVAILAFLHQTQDFFSKQRMIWALIVIAFGMSPTSGAGLFSFAGRIIATAVSLVLSLIVWYIVDGHIGGVIVFLYLANVLEFYFYIKYPRFFGPCVIAIVTLNVIVAYELQVGQLGIAAETESSGQPYYPVYLFGPYKLLTVLAGCTIAFFWTIFPYPITSRARVRKILGRGLFVLANFYSCMHTTIEVWIEGASVPHSLARTRKKLFSEEMTLITTMRMFSSFTVYEPPVGGKFPKTTYDNIISDIQSIVVSMGLMAIIPEGVRGVSGQQEQKWLRQLAEVIHSTDFNSHQITSLLCHLSAAVTTGTALPPYLSPPDPFPLARKLRTVSDGLMDRNNSQDPAFSAFVSLEVLSSMVNKNLLNLIRNVKSLVGEVKFDGHVQRQPGKKIDGQGNGDKID